MRVLKEYKELLAPFLLVIFAVSLGIYFRPIMTIDETRYIGVAWEMFDKHSFVLPLINGEPYDHKMPILFWLIHLSWYIFGVNEFSFRFIPLIFALGNLFLTYKIYKILWQDDREGRVIAVWILAGTVLYIFYSSLLMFDIMLGFWVLLAVYGIIKASKAESSGYYIIAVAVFLGVLTKGPVVGAYILPLFLGAKWYAKVNLSFYLKFALAGIAGLLASLVWVIPAINLGGEAYAKGLLLKQSVGRAVNSFAHKRPIWWYIPVIIGFSMPWILYSKFWQKLRDVKLDNSFRFLLIWLIGTFIIFSLISGKQVHYLIPIVPAIAMLIARVFSTLNLPQYRVRAIGLLFLILATAFAIAPKFIKQELHYLIDFKAIVIGSLILFSYALFLLFKKFNSKMSFIKSLAISSLLLMFTIHYIAHTYLKTQDLHKISQKIATLQDKGYTIIHYGKYADQFHFLGRLHKPLKVMYSRNKIDNFLQNHPKSAVVVYKKRRVKYNKSAVLSSGKLRTTNILLVPADKFSEF